MNLTKTLFVKKHGANIFCRKYVDTPWLFQSLKFKRFNVYFSNRIFDIPKVCLTAEKFGRHSLINGGMLAEWQSHVNSHSDFNSEDMLRSSFPVSLQKIWQRMETKKPWGIHSFIPQIWIRIIFHHKYDLVALHSPSPPAFSSEELPAPETNFSSAARALLSDASLKKFWSANCGHQSRRKTSTLTRCCHQGFFGKKSVDNWKTENPDILKRYIEKIY